MHECQTTRFRHHQESQFHLLASFHRKWHHRLAKASGILDSFSIICEAFAFHQWTRAGT